VVLVTGAASGIGAALAGALTTRGAQLICADIDADGLKNTVEQIGGAAQRLHRLNWN
jgi:NADP-dependent 3-hydroxy acid dehydrogenase YdfG